MVKKKTENGGARAPHKASEDRVVHLDIREIRTNSQNPRESSPTLISLGWGLFTKIEGSDKPAIVQLALSDNPDEKAEYVKLIRRFDPKIAETAASMLIHGQIQAARVRPIPEGGYDLIVGVRRTLARLFNHCMNPGDYPARLDCIVTEVNNDHDAMYMSFDENAQRMSMSPIEEAKWFHRLKQGGLKINEIGERTSYDGQVIRQRLDLLKLPQADQDKVHEGELGVVKALKMVRGHADSTSPANRGKGRTGDNTRAHMPTLKQAQVMYETDAKLHEEVRKWMAGILQIQYATFAQLQKMKEEHAKKEAEKAAVESAGK